MPAKRQLEPDGPARQPDSESSGWILISFSPPRSLARGKGRARNVQIPPGRRRTVPHLRTGKPPKRLPDGQASMRIPPVAAKAIPTGNVEGRTRWGWFVTDIL